MTDQEPPVGKALRLNQQARAGPAHPKLKQAERRTKIKLVQIVGDPSTAKLISDPMRRAILNLLRRQSLTGAELAESLGLTDATVNYHIQLLRRGGLLVVARKEEEEHGIMQKFYAPSAYLYLPDVANLPKEVARYYYPINIERVRGVLSVGGKATGGIGPRGQDVDELGEEFAESLVQVAGGYAGTAVYQGEGEGLVSEIYSRALSGLKRAK